MRIATTFMICAMALILVIPFSFVMAGTDGTVARNVSSLTPEPGDVVTITLTPSGFEGFYAVSENIGNLEYDSEHTADNKEQDDMTFIMLEASEFSYEVRVPRDAEPGDEFTINGQFWTDPDDKKDVGETILKVTIAPDLLGEINGDGRVDYRDLAMLGASYGTSKGDSDYNSEVDLNNDDRVDGDDLAILRDNYGMGTP